MQREYWIASGASLLIALHNCVDQFSGVIQWNQEMHVIATSLVFVLASDLNLLKYY